MALSIDDLRSFLLVVQERSVTRAARHMGVSQQSVSERIRRLERRIGVQLFSRVPHGVQPTPAGYRMVPYAAQCVSLLDEALAVIDDDDLVRVRVQRSAGQAVMPYLENLAAASRIEVSTGGDAAALLDAVAEGSIDVAVGVFVDPHANAVPGSSADPGGEVGEGAGAEPASSGNGKNGKSPIPTFQPHKAAAAVRTELLFSDPVVWVVPPEHPLASRHTPVSLLELNTVHGIDENEPVDAQSGPRVVARSAVAPELADGRLVEVAVDQVGWVVPISIAFRAADHDRPAITTLKRAVIDGHALAAARQSGAPQQPLPEGSP